MGYQLKDTCCAVCGGRKTVFVGQRVPRAELPYKPVVADIVKCKNCGLIYPNPMPIPDEKQRRENYGNAESYFPAEVSRERLDFYAALFGLVNKDPYGKGKILDVGCGRGEMLYAAMQKGWEACGVETSPDFARYAIKKFGANVKVGDLKSHNIEAESFDVVSFIVSLEHTYNPKELVVESNRILKRGGLLLIQTMNAEGLIYRLGDLYYRMTGRRYTTCLSPTFPSYQVYGFSAGSLSYLLNNTGFDLVSVCVTGGAGNTEKAPSSNLSENILRGIRRAFLVLAVLMKSGQVLTICAKKR